MVEYIAKKVNLLNQSRFWYNYTNRKSLQISFRPLKGHKKSINQDFLFELQQKHLLNTLSFVKQIDIFCHLQKRQNSDKTYGLPVVTTLHEDARFVCRRSDTAVAWMTAMMAMMGHRGPYTPIKSHWLRASSEHEVFDIVQVWRSQALRALNIFRRDHLLCFCGYTF